MEDRDAEPLDRGWVKLHCGVDCVECKGRWCRVRFFCARWFCFQFELYSRPFCRCFDQKGSHDKVVVDAVVIVVVAIILVVVYSQLQDSSTQEQLSKVTLPKHDSSDFDFNRSLDLDRQYLKLGRRCFRSRFFSKYCEPIGCYLI